MKILRRHKKLIIIILTIAIVSGFGILNRSQKDDSLSTAQVKQGTLEDTLVLSGEISADRIASLSFLSAGRLTYVGVTEGQRIEKGTTVASLDTRSVKKNLQKELNDYAKSRNDFDQSRDDNETILNDTIKRTLENTQYDLNNAVLDVELQDLSREYSYLTSPISGIVTKASPKSPGVNITATSAVYEIVDPSSVYFSASIDQSDVTSINVGDRVKIVIDAFPDKDFSATVSSISFSPKVDETGTVYEVKLVFDEIDSAMMRLAMTGDAEFILRRQEQALYIPLLYLQEDETGQKFVYLLKNGKREKKNVKTGIETEYSIEIKNGLALGDIVSE